MQLTTKSRYAVNSMVDIALNAECENTSISLSEIANRQDITIAYLEQIFSKLKKNGLVDSSRGPGGGYKLKKPADKISILEVINAVEEDIKIKGCSQNDSKSCQKKSSKCLTHDLWDGLSHLIQNYLLSTSLQNVIDGDLEILNKDKNLKKIAI